MRGEDRRLGGVALLVPVIAVALLFLALAKAPGIDDSAPVPSATGRGEKAASGDPGGDEAGVGARQDGSQREERAAQAEGAGGPVDPAGPVGTAGADRAFARHPPFMLPASLHPRGYEQGSHIETWRAVSDEPCRDVARDLLLELRGSGMRLVKADYLDLFGEAWGCTLEDGGEASLVITLIPERPLSQRSASNPLCMTLIRTGVPELELQGDATGKIQQPSGLLEAGRACEPAW
jgi:hypothetical protein